MLVKLPKGKISVLASPPNVEVGKWYIVVECRSCKGIIYALADSSNGQNPRPFGGEGKFRIPCHSCSADEQFDPTELHSHLAQEKAIFQVKRLTPSGGSRQPLARKYVGVKPIFGATGLINRPEAAAALGRCLALWTEAESELANVLSRILKANAEPSVAMFLAIRNSRSQSEVMDAAAKVALNAEDYELYGAIMATVASAQKERNHLAHGQFGFSHQIKRGVLWTDPMNLVRHGLRLRLEDITPEHTERLLQQTFVYEPEDIETVNVMIEDCILTLRQLAAYVERDPSTVRAESYLQLSSRPRVQQELNRLRQGQKKTQSKPH